MARRLPFGTTVAFESTPSQSLATGLGVADRQALGGQMKPFGLVRGTVNKNSGFAQLKKHSLAGALFQSDAKPFVSRSLTGSIPSGNVRAKAAQASLIFSSLAALIFIWTPVV